MADTDFSNWFLTEAEIRDARGGVRLPRTLAPMSSGNEVTPLVDGQAYMKALLDDVRKTSGDREDFLHFTAWRLDWSLDVDPPQVSGEAPTTLTVGEMFTDMIKRGVVSRTMIWSAPGQAEGKNNYRSYRELVQLVGHDGPGGVIWDTRLASVLGSFHQKTAALRREDELIAYCGGIDLAADRWDTPMHDDGSGQGRPGKGVHDGWHDVQARIRGPAALDVWQNFRDRWNDPLAFPTTVPPPFRAPRRPPKIRTAAPPVSPISGATHHVQHWRTFACRGERYPGFAPVGESTCLAGYLRAIRRARKYIYIEDQYLYWDVIAYELADVVRKKQIERLVILVPPRTDIPWPFTLTSNWHQNQFTQILTQAAQDDPSRVGIYHMVQPATSKPIYVHAKVLIVDDILAVIGSPNIGLRSMTYDAEIATVVIDAKVENGACVFARDLRRQLWGEHLGLATAHPDLADPIKAADLWRTQARAGDRRVREHTDEFQSPRREDPLRWRLVAPEGRCQPRTSTDTIGNKF